MTAHSRAGTGTMTAHSRAGPELGAMTTGDPPPTTTGTCVTTTTTTTARTPVRGFAGLSVANVSVTLGLGVDFTQGALLDTRAERGSTGAAFGIRCSAVVELVPAAKCGVYTDVEAIIGCARVSDDLVAAGVEAGGAGCVIVLLEAHMGASKTGAHCQCAEVFLALGKLVRKRFAAALSVGLDLAGVGVGLRSGFGAAGGITCRNGEAKCPGN